MMSWIKQLCCPYSFSSNIERRQIRVHPFGVKKLSYMGSNSFTYFFQIHYRSPYHLNQISRNIKYLLHFIVKQYNYQIILVHRGHFAQSQPILKQLPLQTPNQIRTLQLYAHDILQSHPQRSFLHSQDHPV